MITILLGIFFGWLIFIIFYLLFLAFLEIKLLVNFTQFLYSRFQKTQSNKIITIINKIISIYF